jgi:tRNA (guanosine-2'-O-)-methyltransferase
MEADDPVKILLLGEGNLSFSLALCHRFTERCVNTGIVPIDLTTTVFDSEEEVYRKYPESKSILSRLQKLNANSLSQIKVTVKFGFDATKDYSQQLSLATGLPCRQQHKFDAVIFNFPHLGIEDAETHGRMMAHVMHCAKDVLSRKCSVNKHSSAELPSGKDEDIDHDYGCFFLSLADAQHARWGVTDQAVRNDMKLVCNLRFYPQDWPGYEVKRHINGKNFERRVEDCSYFCYSQTPTPRSNALLQIMRDRKEVSMTIPEKLEGDEPPSKRKRGSSKNCKEKSKNMEVHKVGKLSKRRMHTSTLAMWQNIGQNDDKESTAEVTKPYQCKLCLKTYTTEQAVISHCYNVHVLPSDTPAPSIDATKSDQSSETIAHVCEKCDPKRTFNSLQALESHLTAVHGRHEVQIPHWADAGRPSHSAVSISHIEKEIQITYECKICAMRFSTKMERDEHENNGFQPKYSVFRLHCSCGKSFTEQRGLLQHQNHCSGDVVADGFEKSDVDHWTSFEYGDLNDIANNSAATTAHKESFSDKVQNILSTLTHSQVISSISMLSTHVTKSRLERFHHVLDQRINSVRFVFENPSNINNTWAALRTIDALGLQYVDVIMDETTYGDKSRRKSMRLSLGTQKWMSLIQHKDTKSCISNLKAQGYTVYVSDIHHTASQPLADVDFAKVVQSGGKIAIVLGNEKHGISPTARKDADAYFYSPMRGFAESLNVSAFCALLCGHLLQSSVLTATNTSTKWDASDKDRVLLQWLAADVADSTALIRANI